MTHGECQACRYGLSFIQAGIISGKRICSRGLYTVTSRTGRTRAVEGRGVVGGSKRRLTELTNQAGWRGVEWSDLSCRIGVTPPPADRQEGVGGHTGWQG